MMIDVEVARARLGLLTARQREVLDLVVAHKSSKEIAISLGIAPNTVDQRILAAREKLGAEGRRDLARTYTSLVTICGQTTSGFPYLDSEMPGWQVADKVTDEGPVFTLSDAGIINIPAPWLDGPASLRGLGALDDRFGIAGRVIAIFVAFALLALALLAVVTMMMNLSRMM